MNSNILQTINIVNFKGVSNKTFEFDPKNTTIVGDNGSGKSTIMHAFTWVMCGFVDQKKDFEIFNRKLPEKEVDISLQFSGEKGNFTLQKKAIKKGQKITYKYLFESDSEDLLPITATSFKEKVSSLFGFPDGLSENILRNLIDFRNFSFLSNVDKKKFIEEVVGIDGEIDINGKKYEGVDQLSKQINFLKKQIKEKNAAVLEKRNLKNSLNEQLFAIKNTFDKATYDIISGKVVSLKRKQVEYDRVSSEEEKNVSDKILLERDRLLLELDKKYSGFLHSQELNKINARLSEISNNGTRVSADVKVLNGEISVLKTSWSEVDDRLKRLYKGLLSKQCDYCGSTLTKDNNTVVKEKQQEMLAERKKVETELQKKEKDVKEKEALLKDIRLQYKQLVSEQEKAKEKNNTDRVRYNEECQIIKDMFKEKIEAGTAQISNNLKKEIADDKERLASLELKLGEMELDKKAEEKKELLRGSIADITSEIQKTQVEINDLIQKRVVLENGRKAHLERLEAKCGGLFGDGSVVKLFDLTQDGDVKSIFNVLVDGVEFDSLNYAGKILASVNFHRTLYIKYGVKLPLFLDNAESFQNKAYLQFDDRQTILLVVSHKPHKRNKEIIL